MKKQGELDDQRLQEELKNSKLSIVEITRQKNCALNEQHDLLLQKKGQESIVRQQAQELKQQQFLLN